MRQEKSEKGGREPLAWNPFLGTQQVNNPAWTTIDGIKELPPQPLNRLGQQYIQSHSEPQGKSLGKTKKHL